MNPAITHSMQPGGTHHNSPEAICIYFAVFFLPLKRAASLGWIGLPWGITFGKLFIGFALILWIMKLILKKDPGLFSWDFSSLLKNSALFYILASIASILNTTVPSEASVIIVKRVFNVIFFFTIINVIRSKKILRMALIMLVLGTALEASSGVYELITHKSIINMEEVYSKQVSQGVLARSIIEEGEIVKEGEGVRIQGTAVDADVHAYMNILAFGIVLGLMFIEHSERKWWIRLFYFLLLSLFAINIYASVSRAAWLGIVLCAGIFLIFVQLKHKGLILSFCFIMLVTIFIGLASFSDSPIIDRLTGKTGKHSTDWRLAQVKVGLKAFERHPFLGIGTREMLNADHRYLKVAPEYPKNYAVKMNLNGYLHVLTENGLIGFSAYILIYLSFIFFLIKKIVSSDNPYDKTLGLGILSSFMAHSFLTNFYAIYDSEFMWLLMGLGLALFYKEKPREDLRFKGLFAFFSHKVGYPAKSKRKIKTAI